MTIIVTIINLYWTDKTIYIKVDFPQIKYSQYKKYRIVKLSCKEKEDTKRFKITTIGEVLQ